jgi:hypothetical protein
MTMVITSCLHPLKKQAAYSDYLINFQRAQTTLNNQFSLRANTCLWEKIGDQFGMSCVGFQKYRNSGFHIIAAGQIRSFSGFQNFCLPP